MDSIFFGNKYLLIIGLFVLLFYYFEWQRSKAMLYALMLQAKRLAKDSALRNGREQEQWVIVRAMNILPLSVKIFLNENILRSVVHELYHTLEAYIGEE